MKYFPQITSITRLLFKSHLYIILTLQSVNSSHQLIIIKNYFHFKFKDSHLKVTSFIALTVNFKSLKPQFHTFETQFINFIDLFLIKVKLNFY